MPVSVGQRDDNAQRAIDVWATENVNVAMYVGCSGSSPWRREPAGQLCRVHLGDDDSRRRWHGRPSLQLRRHLPTAQNWQRELHDQFNLVLQSELKKNHMDEKNFRLISGLEKLSRDRTVTKSAEKSVQQLFKPSHICSKVKTVTDDRFTSKSTVL